AQDDAHALRHVEILDHVLQPLAVLRIGDLAGDAAAARRVGHQHRIAAGERQVGGERRALVAALFLDHLHQQDLPALDDLLDLVLAAAGPTTFADFLQRVLRADRFDLAILVVAAIVPIAGIIVVGAVATVVALDIFRDRIGFNGLGDGAGRIVAAAILGIGAVFLVRVILGRRLVRLVPRVVGSFPLVGGAPAVSTAATAAAIASALLAFVLVVLGLSFLGLGAQQRL